MLTCCPLLKAGVLSYAAATECGFSVEQGEPDDEVVARICHPHLGRLVQQRRLLEPTGYVPPAEYEARDYAQAPAA